MKNFTYEEIEQCLLAFYKINKESDYFIPLVKKNGLIIEMREKEAIKLFYCMKGLSHLYGDGIYFTILDKLHEEHFCSIKSESALNIKENEK